MLKKQIQSVANANSKNSGFGSPIAVKRPIRHRIFKSFLLVTLLIISLVTIAVALNLFRLRKLINNNLDSLIDRTAEKSLHSMTISTLQHLDVQVSAKADIINDGMWMFMSRVEQVASYVTDVYTHPELYQGQSVQSPLAENEGKLSVMVRYASDVLPKNSLIKAA